MTNEHRPEKIFRRLRQSDSARPDSEALWHRIEARLEPHPPALASRVTAAVLAASRLPVLRLAGALMVAAAVAIAMWQPADMTEVMPEVATPGPGAATLLSGWEIDVRLVRGFDGVPPADVRRESVDGAGGASRLADLRADLAALVRFDDFGLLGEWTGEVLASGGSVALTPARTLTFEVVGVDTDQGALQIRNVWLEGEERLKVSSEMTLTPGDPHLIGVRPSADVDSGSLFMAISVLDVASDDRQR